jgi:hypothetical protein
VDRSNPSGGGRTHDLGSVDILRERLEASYGEAKEALDAVDGDVVAALAYLEARRAEGTSDLPEFARELIEETRAVVDTREVKGAALALRGQSLFTVPLALTGVAAGVVVLVSAILSNCRIEVTTGEREDDQA